MRVADQMKIILVIEGLLNLLLVFMFLGALLFPKFDNDFIVDVTQRDLSPKEERMLFMVGAMLFSIIILLSLSILVLLYSGYTQKSVIKLKLWSIFTCIGLATTVFGFFAALAYRVGSFRLLSGDVIYAAYNLWALFVVCKFGKQIEFDKFEATFQSTGYTNVEA